ncbi:MAG: fumarylacetoacetate hydrolase family protein [Dehalococcoidia bacterium]|nr:fumarylacetoacetate hydrolase family protein [Dehalococcoidia bacterium]
MKIVRFASNRTTRYGVLEHGVIRAIKGTPYKLHGNTGKSFEFTGSTFMLDEVKLLAPCLPSKIVALGMNYRSHAIEFKLPIPSVPLIFLKPSTAVIGPEDKIVHPKASKRVDYECELAVVIGKRARSVDREKVDDYILGYTCFNDVSARNEQKDDIQWTRAKGYDTFAPIGPWIETGISPDDLSIETRLNGELRQSARTKDLIFPVDTIVNFVSSIMTLLPGDVIATGTPSGIAPMKPGDVVEVTIENIGTLRNFVVAQE